MQESVFSAVAKQDGGRKGQKVSFRSSSLFTRFDNRLSASICHYIQLDISNTATASYDSPSKSHCHHFKVSNSEEEDQTWTCSQIMASTRTNGGVVDKSMDRQATRPRMENKLTNDTLHTGIFVFIVWQGNSKLSAFSR